MRPWRLRPTLALLAFDGPVPQVRRETNGKISIAGIDYSRQGPDEKAYGLNVMLSTGGPLSFYPYGGLSQTSLKFDGVDKKFTTYQGGVGLGVSPAPKALSEQTMQSARLLLADPRRGSVTIGNRRQAETAGEKTK